MAAPGAEEVDLSALDPVPVKKTLVVVNNFVATTARFLNHFSALCEERLSGVERHLAQLETTLAILEAKLNSVPELRDMAAAVAAPDVPAGGCGLACIRQCSALRTSRQRCAKRGALRQRWAGRGEWTWLNLSPAVA